MIVLNRLESIFASCLNSSRSAPAICFTAFSPNDPITLSERAGFCFYGTQNSKGSADTLFFMRGDDISALESHYLLMGLNGNSELRLVNSNSAVLDLVKSAVFSAWPPGLSFAELYLHPGSYRFCVEGKPWKCSGKQLIEAHLMLIRLFDDFSANGYRVVATLSLGTYLVDKSTFILRSVPHSLLVPEKHIAVINEGVGTMTLVNFSVDLVVVVRKCVEINWFTEHGIKKMGWSFCGSFEIVFGAPVYDSSAPCGAWVMLVAIISAIEKEGWRLMSSADVSARTSDESNGNTSDMSREMANTFFFARPCETERSNVPSVLPTYRQVSSSSRFKGSSLPSYCQLDFSDA